MDDRNKKEKEKSAPTPEVPVTRPWEPGAETPVADARTDGGTMPHTEGVSLLGNTALGKASLGNTLPDLPPAEAGDPVLTAPLISNPFADT